MDYRERIQELRRILNENGYRYYVLDAPTMSDYEYDMLNRELEELEAQHPEEITPDSPTQRVGGKILEGFQPYTHQVPLESLQDVFSHEETAHGWTRRWALRRSIPWSRRWMVFPLRWNIATACLSGAPPGETAMWGRT